MAFIGESRKDKNSVWKYYACLDENECELLMKAVGPLVGRSLKTLEYYKDKLESGEATEKQTDKLCKAEDDFESIISIRETLLTMIKYKKK